MNIMELWFTEYQSKHVSLSLKVREQLFGGQSEFQHIAILDTYEFGRVLTLDDCLMVTEKDEFIYHDMIVHVPMAVNPDIKKILVIGAGDGGTIRELTRYKGIEHIDMVEIDRMVVEACKTYLPKTSCSLEDPRVSIYYEDGLKFVRRNQNNYDLIIVDSTDPFGPGEGLFTKEFYGSCYNCLNESGILVNQHESTFYDEYVSAMKRAHKRIRGIFPVASVYQAHIPTYPSGYWLFGFASKKYHPIKDLKADEWNGLSLKTGYYNTDLHIGAFALPNYVKEQLNE